MHEPFVEELIPPPRPCDAFLRLCARPHCLFLDSARRDPLLGRYSFVAADPFDFLSLPADGGDGLAELARRIAEFPAAAVPGLPHFQGGAAGLLSYDLGRSLERLPTPRYDEFRVPALAIGFYDTVVAFDHATGRVWIISHGWPETDAIARRRRAAERLREVREILDEPVGGEGNAKCKVQNAKCKMEEDGVLENAPQFSVSRAAGLLSNFTREMYLETVRRAIEYIRAGDVFQVNLAQRLLYPAHDDSVSLYLRLRERNPATFAGYFDLGDFQIVSASPERFLQVRGSEVEARPIKGTRRRTAWPEADLFGGDELRSSEKDRAENVMIVDLLRNDLSRVCLPDSVRVSQLCQVETYEFVQHLVSAVRGTLRPGLAPLDLVRAAFPGGSITGAPKVRAMEIIAELEQVARGPYCGSLCYLGFDGTFDSSILIRTITAGRSAILDSCGTVGQHGWWQFPVGGGIVSQSTPEQEYEETWHKAEGLLRALS